MTRLWGFCALPGVLRIPGMFVGGDAHIAPANHTDFTENQCEFDGTQWGDVGIAPYA